MTNDHRYRIIEGDCIKGMKSLPDGCIQTCITSPPYWGLRNYGHDDQLGAEKTPEEFVANMVEVFREVRRVLRDDGTLWLNLGDSYASNGCYINSWLEKEHNKGKKHLHVKNHERYSDRKAVRGGEYGIKAKDLVGIPWRVAFALQADGWYLRQDIIWSKPNPMPESVQDRCTRAHEYIFMFSKKPHYYYDHEAIKEPAQNWGTRNRSEMRDGTTDPKLKHHGLKGKEWEENPMKNKRSVWTVNTKGYKGAHFAVYPKELITPCVRAGTSKGGCCSECGMPYQRNIVDPIANLEPVEAIERKGVMLTPEDSALVLWLEQNGGDYRISIAGEKHADNWQDVPFGNGRRSQLESKGYTLFHWGVNKKTDEWKPGCTCSLKKEGVQSTRCTVLDPFNGSATTGVVALNEDCHYIGLELNPEYIELSHKRIAEESPMTLMEMFK